MVRRLAPSIAACAVLVSGVAMFAELDCMASGVATVRAAAVPILYLGVLLLVMSAREGGDR